MKAHLVDILICIIVLALVAVVALAAKACGLA